ncbi:phosphoribosylformylglycinamidine cyclo-ligase [Candidatus Fermentibacteria bacterium]|nr:phosphoribosylformylglycinamidine cyclo-ligase [Candidatus Fermentibacteria bacterium]
MAVTPGTDYEASGVSIPEAEKAARMFKEHVRRTYGRPVLSDVGSFGGMFRFPVDRYEEPILVASTDGVGTKLRVASMTGRFNTLGVDIVNHCVNDVLVQGAEPLFFLDYLGCESLDASVASEIVSGVADACVENGCALLGGELAEMPGFYGHNDYDLIGTIVGVVERKRMVDGTRVEPGMSILGMPSSGLHTNGYSLARHVLFEKGAYGVDDRPSILNGRSIGEALMRPHRSYLGPVMALLGEGLVEAVCHVTGGGIPGNLPRVLPDGCGAEIDLSWEVPPIFRLIAEEGEVEEGEMYRVFNMGAGMLLVCDSEKIAGVEDILLKRGEEFFPAGRVTRGSEVYLVGRGVDHG